jgi:hypothetical protein
VKEEGVDLFIALDVSLSMKAEDLKPNRLEKARLEIRNLIDRLKGDRIGLIVFAGDAYTQFPLTTDYGAAYLFLDVVNTDVAPVPGTSIGSAIKRSMESFNFDEPTTKVVVIITDGESTDGDAFGAAEDAHKKEVLIYTIGMGSPPVLRYPSMMRPGARWTSSVIVTGMSSSHGLMRFPSRRSPIPEADRITAHQTLRMSWTRSIRRSTLSRSANSAQNRSSIMRTGSSIFWGPQFFAPA